MYEWCRNSRCLRYVQHYSLHCLPSVRFGSTNLHGNQVINVNTILPAICSLKSASVNGDYITIFLAELRWLVKSEDARYKFQP